MIVANAEASVCMERNIYNTIIVNIKDIQKRLLLCTQCAQCHLPEHSVISTNAKTSVWNVKDNKSCRYVHLYIKYTRCTEAHVQGLLNAL